ncbi:MAG: histidinol-phosphate transaminase [Stenotrophomonas sp.]|uniref:histidinol-phosphate transaminase n=1 Tax=Stenotrophomonas sp. TaxID=69392 RepID=UPI0013533735|nr:histidinol-phosphate transaminase [Stenotrophomonas sp.]MTI74849.1 histidinol-phosphate transaminase [Stenotrophomonas sp.]
MSGVLDLVREDLRGFAGYASARSTRLEGEIWLNANESAWPNPGDAGGLCRRYPEPQPQALRERLATLYGCTSEQLLVGRGSDEAIDLLVRALCVPGRDGVLYTPPVFGMYAVSARLQNALALVVPLRDDEAGLVPDIEAIIATAKQGNARLVFLCSPSNPGGRSIALAQVEQVAVALRGQALVVVDEAYAEFADEPSAVSLLPRHDNIAVLRTLSKAHALAAARIGCVIADASLIAVLRRCQAPYPIPAPCTALALEGLSDAALARTRERIAVVRAERERLGTALARLPGVRRVYPSDANFLLVRLVDAEAAFQRLLVAGVVVRDQRGAPQLHDALRITLGTPEQNARVLGVLATLESAP